jgi:hypothetical protein
MVAPHSTATEQGLPRISLVTAVYNGERYLEDTIRSVLYQGYPNLEYVIVNDGSTDKTKEIIQNYEPQLSAVIHRPNRGLVYAALNAGFERTTGEIMGWLNASDKLHSGGSLVVGSVFSCLPEVEWITGRPTGFSVNGMATHVGALPKWSRTRFLAGANQHIQQESTFWRRSLWEKAGGYLNPSFRAEGDFDLWVRFFRHARLYPVDALIAGYRFHTDALSYAGRKAYDQGCEGIIDRELDSLAAGKRLKLFRRLSETMMKIPIVRVLWRGTVIKGLYRFPASDLPPVIELGSQGWVFRKK